MSQTGHNLENHLETIGQLVREAYDLEGLRWLCLTTPEFRPVYDDMSEEAPKSKLIRRLLEHCLRQGLLEKLVALTEQDAPGVYARYKERLGLEQASDGADTDPPTEMIEQLKTLIAEKMRRLHGLQLKQAKYGLEAPVSIQIEIEDLEAEIAQLKQKLTDLSS